MLRTIWAGFIAVLVTIPLALATLAVAALKSNARLIDGIIWLWATSIIRAAGIQLRAENTDVIDRKQRYIIIANHHSYFDIPCIFAAIPQPIRFMA
ncbi:MAG TPA: 1-acyl-sn-glycerol-3-phosphate acyltransferase, partial [Thermoanaerobaculia bacterium]|nr:1-acyl-sn-glycerol-3-phosphate acyltransferase [Thermoanaerobaculia bacterium]